MAADGTRESTIRCQQLNIGNNGHDYLPAMERMASHRRESTASDGETYICPHCDVGYHESVAKFWIACDCCHIWFHGECENVSEYQSGDIDIFHCSRCCVKFGPSRLKPITNSHRNVRTESCPEEKPVQLGTPAFIGQLMMRTFHKPDETVAVRLRGQQMTLSHLLKLGFDIPILVETRDGLDMVLPPKSYTVDDVAAMLGPDYEVDVIDVIRQMSVKQKMSHFAQQMKLDVHLRKDIYNCISLEVSKTPMKDMVKPPEIVNKLSWVDNCWPGDCDLIKPFVSKYCLMSMRNSYTDFHIDFGGTSVWYHVLRGCKIFYLIRPTAENLKRFELWCNTNSNNDIFFGDRVDACYKLELHEGQTFFIPTGWIHAVFTPTDSIVFGGNFLHSLNIELQLAVHQMEVRVRTPEKYRFPFFEFTHWYAAPVVLKLFRDTIDKGKVPKNLSAGVSSLVNMLKEWNRRSQANDDRCAPQGLHCQRIIKDLIGELKRAEKLNESTQQPVKALPSQLETSEPQAGSTTSPVIAAPAAAGSATTTMPYYLDASASVSNLNDDSVASAEEREDTTESSNHSFVKTTTTTTDSHQLVVDTTQSGSGRSSSSSSSKKKLKRASSTESDTKPTGETSTDAKKLKKGLATPKQRLAKIMKLKKSFPKS